jgi:hypothetical protein
MPMLDEVAIVETIDRLAERSSPNTRAGNGHVAVKYCHRRHVLLRGNNRIVFKLSDELHDACDTEAQRRHMTINALMRLLLTRIVRDKLFDAVIGK